MDRFGFDPRLAAGVGHRDARGFFLKAANRFVSYCIGGFAALLLSAYAYDVFAPVYKDQKLTDVRLEDGTLKATLSFMKSRACSLDRGGISAHAYYHDVKIPALYVNAFGTPLQLSTLAADKAAYRLDVGWKLAFDHTVPSAVSVSFDGSCGFGRKRLVIGPLPTGLNPSGG